jgi:hypothetical protein
MVGRLAGRRYFQPEIDRFVKGLQPKPCGANVQIIEETHLTMNLTPPFQRDWRPSLTRTKLSNARSGWFCQRDKSPIAMISDLAHFALRRRKSRHGQSCMAKLSERDCAATSNCKVNWR